MRASRVIVVSSVVAACGFHGKAQPHQDDASSTDSPAAGDAPPGIDAAIDAAGCPPNYVVLANAPATSKYRVVGGGSQSPTVGRTTWIAAELDCRDDGAGTHLAVPETMSENQAFIDVLSGASKWLGVTDAKTEGTWIPIVQTTGWYANWAGGTPGNDDCLLLSRTSFHEAMPCTSALQQYDKGFICECDGKSVDPTAF